MTPKKTPKKNTRITKSVVSFAKFLQFIGTPLAGNFVLKIFQSPLNHTMPQREQMMYKSAVKERLKIPAIDKEIQVYKYGYSKKKVLILHGWAGRGTQLFTISDKLLENRYMVISIDGPAHGFSEGKRTNMTEFAETVKVIQDTYGPFEVAIGHSFGGMVLLKSTADFLKINKLVVIGTANDVRNIIHDLASKLQLKAAVAEYVLKKLQKQFKTNLETITSAASATKIDIQTLVIHDTADKEVPVSCAYEIRQNLSKGTLLITNGLGHQRILKDGIVQNRILEFLKNEKMKMKRHIVPTVIARCRNVLFLSLILVSLNLSAQKTMKKDTPKYVLSKTETEWKAILSPIQYSVLRDKATERPFTGKYDDFYKKGTYTCAACGTQLFKSNTKFDAHCGWPSFDEAIPGTVLYKKDTKFGMVRTEILCAKCGGHLGHVFDDGPTDTGKRFCVNSASLSFNPQKKEE